MNRGVAFLLFFYNWQRKNPPTPHDRRLVELLFF